jgi:hypothetical protein
LKASATSTRSNLEPFDSHGTRSDFVGFAATDQHPVLLLAQYFLPVLVRRPFLGALPIDIFLVGETIRKMA